MTVAEKILVVSSRLEKEGPGEFVEAKIDLARLRLLLKRSRER